MKPGTPLWLTRESTHAICYHLRTFPNPRNGSNSMRRIGVNTVTFEEIPLPIQLIAPFFFLR